ncbi:hypothetical protein SteCoe_26509 [Stentor coeruleus]|uniref:UBC core domain-containing protein n=1 Tax=Stentor coeruleus TaxID=5963 RepID=A0A1R2BCP7_9CILI|nr:hypothetical protein SteCoe_26509 [Stentor coeruleus]
MRSRACRRLEKELVQIRRDHSSFEIIPSEDEELNWRVVFSAPEDCIYTGEKYTLNFTFDDNYPVESPEVVFVGKPPVHEHVYSNGFICLSSLYNGWRPSFTVASTVLSIISMLASAKSKKKPKDDKEVVRTTKGQRSKDQSWEFHDETC